MGIFIITIGAFFLFRSVDLSKKVMSKTQKRNVLISVLIILIGIIHANSEYFPFIYEKNKQTYKYPVNMKDRFK